MSKLLKREKGFTLIEIVLVLAIAALIILMVFLALSGAQKSRRDTQRKSDAGRVASDVEQYSSNHGGSIAGLTTATLATYVANITDPGTGTGVTVGAGNVVPAMTNATASYIVEAKDSCTNGTPAADGVASHYAVIFWSETGGAESCVGNQ